METNSDVSGSCETTTHPTRVSLTLQALSIICSVLVQASAGLLLGLAYRNLPDLCAENKIYPDKSD